MSLKELQKIGHASDKYYSQHHILSPHIYINTIDKLIKSAYNHVQKLLRKL